MKKLLIILFVFCASPVLADTQFDCDDVLGLWQGDRFDNATQAQRKTIASFVDPSNVYLYFEYDKGNSQSYETSYSTWTCDGHILTITHPPSGPDAKGFVDTYEILDLNSSYFVYRAFGLDCEGRSDDCGEITYEMVRLPDNFFQGDGC